MQCPDCRQWLGKNENACGCGWEPTNSSGVLRCIYKHKSDQCPYPSSSTLSRFSLSDWYCLDHFQNLNNAEKCIEILMQAEVNFIAVMEERIHWSVKLIPEEYAKAKKKINNMYLELFRK